MELNSLFSKEKAPALINTGILVFALVIAGLIYKNQQENLSMLQQAKENENKKNEALLSLSALDKRIKSYKTFLNKKNKSLIITNINNIAKASNVKISSIKPEPEEALPMYIRSPFQLIINVADYATFGRFMANLESSEDVYAADLLSITPNFSSEEDVEEAGRMTGLSVNLKVSTFFYRD